MCGPNTGLSEPRWGAEIVILFSLVGCVVCELFTRLLSDHEEADTRMILHATHAFESCSGVTIYSPDTDVLVIAAYHYWKILQSYTGDETLRMRFHTGNGLKDRYIPAHK